MGRRRTATCRAHPSQPASPLGRIAPIDHRRVTRTSPPPPAGNPPGWKVILALLSLSLSGLLWLSGLLSSLDRPSVGHTLNLRQLEVAALAAPSLPPSLRTALVGSDPRATLARELQRQLDGDGEPLPLAGRLELRLLQTAAASRAPRALDTTDLQEMVELPRRPLLQALASGAAVTAAEQRALLAPWAPSPMLRQLVCEWLSPGGAQPAAARCPDERHPQLLLLQLLAVDLLPIPLLLLGSALLLRELWRGWRHKLPAAAPWRGPALGGVDVTLLIAGGFVVLGEVLTPQLLAPLLAVVLRQANLPGTVAQGVQVLLLYLGLMAAPLVILTAQLRGLGPAPTAGWLQWTWRPLGPGLLQAVRTLLMVLPLVSLASWLIERLWKDPGGSNPLLELVLTSADPLALGLFALTALVLAPLFEETLFRGVLLPVAAQRLGSVGGIVLSAAIFALAHLSLGELVPLFLLGLGLGWLRWRSGRLSTTVLMHALWNGLTFLNLLILAA